MELKIYNPSEENGFLKAIEWNYEELKAELSQKLEDYKGLVYTEEQIKEAILSSQYTAAKQVNTVQLSLYYGVGRYVSQNTRKGVWGTGAIKAISEVWTRSVFGYCF